MTIKEIREAKHLTQQQVADAVGITSTAYARIERGEAVLADCKYSTVIKLFAVLGEEILGGTKTVEKIICYIGNANGEILYNSFKDFALNEAENFINNYKEYVDDCSDEAEIIRTASEMWDSDTDFCLCDEYGNTVDQYDEDGKEYVMADSSSAYDDCKQMYLEKISNFLDS